MSGQERRRRGEGVVDNFVFSPSLGHAGPGGSK